MASWWLPEWSVGSYLASGGLVPGRLLAAMALGIGHLLGVLWLRGLMNVLLTSGGGWRFQIYKNTGKGPRTYEEGLSAYSIFNPNLERIEGDISLHELEGQIRSGGGRVPTARGMGSGLTRLLEEEEARDLQRALELSRRDH